MKLLVSASGVGLAYARTPFAKDVYRPEAPLPFGLTVAEILRTIPDLPDRAWTHGVVHLNFVYRGVSHSEPVPREMWAAVRLSEKPVPVALALHVPFGNRGGGGGGEAPRKNTFALVASIALIAATTAISAGALGAITGASFLAAGTWGTAATAAGVGIVGGLAIAALSPPPSAPRDDEEGGGAEFGQAAASGNQLIPGGVIPRIIGTHRYPPPFAAYPLVEIVGKDEFVEAIFAMSGAHSWAGIRIDGLPIETLDDIQSQTRQGTPASAAVTLVTRQSFTDPQPMEIIGHDYDLTQSYGKLKNQDNPTASTPPWKTKTTRRSPHEIWLHIVAPSGIGRNENPDLLYLLPLRLRMRERGTATWINLPEVMLSSRVGHPLKFAVKLMFEDAPAGALPTPPEWIGPVMAFKTVPLQNVAPVGSGGWSANAYFSAGAGDSVYMVGTEATTNVRNVHLYEDRVEFYLGADAGLNPQSVFYPPLAGAGLVNGAVWEVQMRRGFIAESESFNPVNYHYIPGTILDMFGYRTLTASQISEENGHYGGDSPDLITDMLSVMRNISVWNEHPIAGNGSEFLALLALKAKNRSLSNVTALLSGLVPDWNGSAWTGAVQTSNPAPHYRYILTGDVNADPLPTALIDHDVLIDWRTRCNTEGFTCDTIADGANADELLKVLAGCGYARPRQSELWGVVQDRDRSEEAPVQLFTPRNIANFRFEKAFPVMPHGFRVRYREALSDYEEGQELIVYDDGYSAANAERLEEVTYDGIVSADAAERRAAFDLRQARLRSTFYSFETDAEALVATNGDLVGVQHDILVRSAGFARVKEKYVEGGNVVGLLLDSKIPTRFEADFFSIGDFFDVNDVFALSGSTGLAIRLKSPTLVDLDLILVKELSDPLGYTDTVEFAAPFADPSFRLGEGCLVASGELGSEYLRLIVIDVQPQPDFRAALTLVDEAELLWPRTIVSAAWTINAGANITFGHARWEIDGVTEIEFGNILSALSGLEIDASADVEMSAALEIIDSLTIDAVSTLVSSAATGFDASFDASFG